MDVRNALTSIGQRSPLPSVGQPGSQPGSQPGWGPVSIAAENVNVRVRFARHLPILAVLAGFVLSAGCGNQSAEVATDSQPQAPATVAQADVSDPAAVVGQFLDRVRRGGEGTTADELLTQLARQEMTRIGRPLQFPGSPDTQFKVGQSLPIPEQKDAIWVQTTLSEPSVAGEQPVQYEVVWTLRKENTAWRICGFIIDQGEGLDPMVIDFENGDEMEARLAAIEDEESGESR